jgi:limonene-1,2-epoxide hydrolase
MQKPSSKSVATSPKEVVRLSVKAFNDSDLEGALTYFADNAQYMLTGISPGQLDAFHGKKQLRAWFRELAIRHLKIEVEVLKTEGGIVTTKTRTWSDLTCQLGVAPLVAIGQYFINDGKITSAILAIHPESAAKLKAALSHAQE